MERVKSINRLRSQICRLFLVASITFSGCFHQENNQATSPTPPCDQGLELPNHHVYFDPAVGEFVAGQSPIYQRITIGDTSVLVKLSKPRDTFYLGRNVTTGKWMILPTNSYNIKIYEHEIRGKVLATIGDPNQRVTYKDEICIIADRVFLLPR